MQVTVADHDPSAPMPPTRRNAWTIAGFGLAAAVPIALLVLTSPPTPMRIPRLLAARGYSGDDITAIAHGNFIRFLRNAWS